MLSLAPAALAQTTAPAVPQVTLAKRVYPALGFEPRPGGIVIMEVAFTLSANANGVVIEDTLANAGQGPNTAILIPNEPPPIPRSPVLFRPDGSKVEQVPFIQTANQQNRLVHQFQLGNLGPGRYLLYYDVLFSDKLRCDTNVVSGANLRVGGINDKLASAQTTFRLRCV